jgi:hypothetical protein
MAFWRKNIEKWKNEGDMKEERKRRSVRKKGK